MDPNNILGDIQFATSLVRDGRALMESLRGPALNYVDLTIPQPKQGSMYLVDAERPGQSEIYDIVMTTNDQKNVLSVTFENRRVIDSDSVGGISLRDSQAPSSSMFGVWKNEWSKGRGFVQSIVGNNLQHAFIVSYAVQVTDVDKQYVKQALKNDQIRFDLASSTLGVLKLDMGSWKVDAVALTFSPQEAKEIREREAAAALTNNNGKAKQRTEASSNSKSSTLPKSPTSPSSAASKKSGQYVTTPEYEEDIVGSMFFVDSEDPTKAHCIPLMLTSKNSDKTLFLNLRTEIDDLVDLGDAQEMFDIVDSSFPAMSLIGMMKKGYLSKGGFVSIRANNSSCTFEIIVSRTQDSAWKTYFKTALDSGWIRCHIGRRFQSVAKQDMGEWSMVWKYVNT